MISQDNFKELEEKGYLEHLINIFQNEENIPSARYPIGVANITSQPSINGPSVVKRRALT